MLAKLAPERTMLFDAAEILRERGWCQNKLYDEEGRVCALGALVATYNYTDGTCNRAMKLVEARLGNGSLLVIWNNTPGRTADEVINLFESVGLSAE